MECTIEGALALLKHVNAFRFTCSTDSDMEFEINVNTVAIEGHANPERVEHALRIFLTECVEEYRNRFGTP